MTKQGNDQIAEDLMRSNLIIDSIGQITESERLTALDFTAELDKPDKTYEVLKPIPDVDSGKTAPWFYPSVGGVQIDLPLEIDELIEGGFIKKID